MTQGERIASLETEVRLLKQAYEKDMKDVKESLETLLSLRNKGQGVFWLATTLFGTSFAVFLSYVVSWFK